MDPVDALKNGAAMDVWRRMISAQGGDPDGKLPTAKESQQLVAPASGVLTRMDAMDVAIAAWRLGAGRSFQGEKLQLGAGIEMHVKPGDAIQAGQPIYTLHTDEPARFDRALEALHSSFTIGSASDPIHRLPLIIERIEG
jgi:thymidine phosphorylase